MVDKVEKLTEQTQRLKARLEKIELGEYSKQYQRDYGNEPCVFISIVEKENAKPQSITDSTKTMARWEYYLVYKKHEILCSIFEKIRQLEKYKERKKVKDTKKESKINDREMLSEFIKVCPELVVRVKELLRGRFSDITENELQEKVDYSIIRLVKVCYAHGGKVLRVHKLHFPYIEQTYRICTSVPLLNGIFECERGLFSVTSIVAGGYNIQELHIRTIVKPIGGKV